MVDPVYDGAGYWWQWHEDTGVWSIEASLLEWPVGTVPREFGFRNPNTDGVYHMSLIHTSRDASGDVRYWMYTVKARMDGQLRSGSDSFSITVYND